MPVAPPVSYPGVYIQEVPSDVRTIVPVDTATTAFVGRALRGPVDTQTVINSYADFETIFGGLWLQSAMSYVVRDFYVNGGSKAVIVRVYASPVSGDDVAAAVKTAADDFAGGSAPEQEGAGAVSDAAQKAALAPGSTAVTVASAAQAASDAIAGDATASGPKKAAAQAVAKAASDKAAEAGDGKSRLTFGTDAATLTLEASNPGAWGNELRGRITAVDPKVIDQVASRYGVKKDDLFNLIIRDVVTGAEEVFPNVTVVDGPRRLDKVLAGDSTLVLVSGTLPKSRPPFTGDTAADGSFSPLPDKGSPWDDANDKYHIKAAADSGQDGATPNAGTILGSEADRTGMYALEHADIFNMLCLPPFEGTDVAGMADVTKETWDTAAAFCQRRRAMLVSDSPGSWNNKKKAVDGFPNDPNCPSPSENAMLYFPRLNMANPLRDGQVEAFAPCGAVAGIIARTDSVRGVWKAPAGLEAGIRSVRGMTVPLTDAENGELNPLGVNCLRTLPAAGHVVWGARTTVGDDRLASQWKYIPVRRTALFIEETLYRNTQWAVFEPNDEPLWAQLRLNIGVFMHDLFRQGAFQGGAPKDAYFVRCDATTTTQSDINRGIVNVIVGFAPLKPAEFVVIYIQQIAGQLAA